MTARGTEMFGCGCSSLGRDAQLAELASVNAELRAKLGLLMIDDDPVLHVEWGLRYDQLPHDVVFGREANPDGTVTRVAPMPNEVYARQALASPAPIGAKNKVVVCRRVSDWEACDV